uniref:Uncharacterized protein n=1 Tax=Meloidogyne javanica TaxID=6303 RepID=A0A915M6Q2_MELJA
MLIKFPSYKSTGVNFKEETDSSGHKCFQMSGGKVEVNQPGLDGSKKYYVHVETRIGIHGKPERCVNPDKDNCGGIGLPAGTYDDLSLRELNDALHGSKKGMIGCHWIYATVKSV